MRGWSRWPGLLAALALILWLPTVGLADVIATWLGEWDVAFERIPAVDNENEKAKRAYGEGATTDGEIKNVAAISIAAKAKSSVEGRPPTEDGYTAKAKVTFARDVEFSGISGNTGEFTMEGGYIGTLGEKQKGPAIKGTLEIGNPFFLPVAAAFFDYDLYRVSIDPNTGERQLTSVDGLYWRDELMEGGESGREAPKWPLEHQTKPILEDLVKKTQVSNGLYHVSGKLWTFTCIFGLELELPPHSGDLGGRYGDLTLEQALDWFLQQELEKGTIDWDTLQEVLYEDKGYADADFWDTLDLTFTLGQIPEPATLSLLGFGSLVLWARRRRRL
jgi:hypothetical protein